MVIEAMHIESNVERCMRCNRAANVEYFMYEYEAMCFCHCISLDVHKARKMIAKLWFAVV